MCIHICIEVEKYTLDLTNIHNIFNYALHNFRFSQPCYEHNCLLRCNTVQSNQYNCFTEIC
jgi:hypothetical protein